MPTEADARIVVDRLLREADWDIEDKSQVSPKPSVENYERRNLRAEGPQCDSPA